MCAMGRRKWERHQKEENGLAPTFVGYAGEAEVEVAVDFSASAWRALCRVEVVQSGRPKVIMS